MRESLLIFALTTVTSIILFWLIVTFLHIPGILVMIAVTLANGVAQLLMHHGKKKILWGLGGLLVSTLCIMGLSWLLVNLLHL